MDSVTPKVKRALNHYQNKLSRPAYKNYMQDSNLQLELFMDCLSEIIASKEMDGVRHD